ncbi:hypothetical protein [Streptomyces sp. NBC_00503]|uniref:hypothetical protein n=1 Tax=Streptomyces sp. NBC_00503 TaxID=2903659 RepID=UPI002E81EA12|nr:hypothetical protein [Streptomyces sp. NBC_00503]WUD84555.1 DUF11 domain-containing protein [Streptomyces sp. NBC_00503]
MTGNNPTTSLTTGVLHLTADKPTFGTLLSAATCTPTANESRFFDCPTAADDSQIPSTPTDNAFVVNFNPDIKKGVTAHFQISFTVQPAAAGQTFNLNLLSGSFGTQAAPTPIAVAGSEADLAVGLTANPNLRLLDPAVDYRMTFTDKGPGAVQSGTVTAQLPSAVTAVSGLTDGCTYSATTDKVTCPTGTIANGTTQALTFTAHLGVLTLGLPLKATAQRTTSTPTDPNAANDTATANCLAVTGLIIIC